MYDDHLRLIEKRVGDFLLVLIDLDLGQRLWSVSPLHDTQSLHFHVRLTVSK